MKIMKRMHFTCETMRNPFTLLLLASFLLCEPAQAATVTTTADNGPGSLREAIANAAPGEQPGGPAEHGHRHAELSHFQCVFGHRLNLRADREQWSRRRWRRHL